MNCDEPFICWSELPPVNYRHNWRDGLYHYEHLLRKSYWLREGASMGLPTTMCMQDDALKITLGWGIIKTQWGLN